MRVPQFSSYQTRVLLVLALINFVNWVDRQVIFPLFPLLRDEFHVTFEQLGLLVLAFSVVHSCGSLVLGRLADLTSRRKVISYGILFWSGATFLSGIASSFRYMLLSRSMVGVGEAAYTPAATAIISHNFPREVRARVQGVFDLGMFLGGAMGIVLGGIIAGSFGWRPAFFIVGIPGLMLSFAVFRLPESIHAKPQQRIPLRNLARVPAYVMVLISGCFITFAGNAYVIWGTEFVHDYKGLGLREAGLLMGGTVVIAGLLGVSTGAVLADLLAKRFVWGRVLTVSIGFIISAPLIFTALHTSSIPILLVTFGMGTFFMCWYHGPVTAVVHDLIPPQAHSTAIGIYYFLMNSVSNILASWGVGRIADSYGLLSGMHTALAAQVVGGICFLGVIGFIRRDGLDHPALAQYRSTLEPVSSSPEPVPVSPALETPGA
jgi:MFS transporter, Spinster family, sphingosine-1-phosphate transporter